jgi:hypothetical protein
LEKGVAAREKRIIGAGSTRHFLFRETSIHSYLLSANATLPDAAYPWFIVLQPD